ncbi:methyl-accepting chemotaxis protein [Neorhizobium sp. T786]|uniref:methyl-accepting chemotaxis protein n=1 Tax=Pseudorhizobium xiangyangii TaxID=2883104 RepID=UPI001CFFD6B9|nr:methyl-accepting chemotaxis protein [Neorhizobium xiangyangii]MCB5203919.1 methyl-accepting chemotaxis protein [Neorhizobium xiangyangii]
MRDRDRLESELLELRAVADALDSSLRRLATGDIHQNLDAPFPRSLDGMRKDFNRGLASVSTTIDGILSRTRELRAESADLREGLKQIADDEEQRSLVVASTVAGLAGAADASRTQSTHADHISTILHNARLDLDRPKLAAFKVNKDVQQTCQSLAQLKGLVEDAKSMLREASLIALNGGVNAAHEGDPGQEALGHAKSLHTLTQQIGSTVEAISEATDHALGSSVSAAEAADQLSREFDALDLYVEAADSQVQALGEISQRQEAFLNALRTDLASTTRRNTDVETGDTSPGTHLDAIDRAAAEIERQAGRFTPVRVLTPPTSPSPPGTRSHLRLVKT